MMSPDQLSTLHSLSRLFEDGLAGPDQIKQLSDLLATINLHVEPMDNQENELLRVLPS